jgi:hypothetical protein
MGNLAKDSLAASSYPCCPTKSTSGAPLPRLPLLDLPRQLMESIYTTRKFTNCKAIGIARSYMDGTGPLGTRALVVRNGLGDILPAITAMRMAKK